ncbi:MAG: aminoglycoside phosphotransferase family protein [Acidimicrobiales bacterium]
MVTQTASSRVVTLVLCQRDGAILGALAPFDVDVPWWQEMGPVVAGARRAHNIDVVILRLLSGEQPRLGAGGPVTYLAEVRGDVDVAVRPWERSRDPDQPLRASWARPGGPAEDLAWADAALESHGMPRTAPALQVRSWNLSSLWCLPTTRGAAWLKVVPPFFAHEGAILAALGADRVPQVLASDGARTLLADIPGDDLYGASGDLLLSMVDLLIDLQTAWVGRVGELLELTLPDWRRDALTVALTDLVTRWRGRLPEAVEAGLDGLLGGLAVRWDHIDACGLPDTLVHGDFHPGNLRSTGPSHLVLLDWGDSGIGHPMLDQPAFLERLSPADRQAVKRRWTTRWRREVPGCEPDRAASLLAPIGALRQALIYQRFLDGIEPDERIYHALDSARWLERAAALGRT